MENDEEHGAKPEKIEVEVTDLDGKKKRTRSVKLDTEDVIAIGGVIVAVLVVLGMLTHFLPINKFTYGLAGLSGVTALVAKVAVPKGKK